MVYARPDYISTLATSTPIAAHVDVDFELHGCPIDRRQLLEVITALLVGRKPNIPAHSVCFECKQRGNVCVVVAHGTPCLGPVTHAGCGALCPAHHRGCYGCFGPMETPNAGAQVGLLRATGMDEADVAAGLPHVQHRRARVHRAVPGHRRSAAGGRPARRQDGGEHGDPPHRPHARRPRAGPGRGRRRDARAGARRRRRGRAAGDLRAAAVLRGVPARAAAHRTARHHRPHLRDLPGGLPDERVPGHRGGLRGRGRRRRSPTCAGCSTAESGSRVTRCTSTCCMPPTSSATPARSTWPRTAATWSSGGWR